MNELLKKLPSYYFNIEEIKELTNTESKEVTLLNLLTDRGLFNQYIQIANEEGLAYFEKMLGILSANSPRLKVNKVVTSKAPLLPLSHTIKQEITLANKPYALTNQLAYQGESKYEKITVQNKLDYLTYKVDPTAAKVSVIDKGINIKALKTAAFAEYALYLKKLTKYTCKAISAKIAGTAAQAGKFEVYENEVLLGTSTAAPNPTLTFTTGSTGKLDIRFYATGGAGAAIDDITSFTSLVVNEGETATYTPFVPDSILDNYPSVAYPYIAPGVYKIEGNGGTYEITVIEPLYSLGELYDTIVFDESIPAAWQDLRTRKSLILKGTENWQYEGSDFDFEGTIAVSLKLPNLYYYGYPDSTTPFISMNSGSIFESDSSVDAVLASATKEQKNSC